MRPPHFSRFIAIDWSGARGPGYAGVSVAPCEPGGDPPRLVAPEKGRRWTRQAVLDWLTEARPAPGTSWLVGIDFAFCLPEPAGGAQALWARIDTVCGDDEDLLGLRYIGTDPRFWTGGPQPADWNPPLRAAEVACTAAGLGHPQTPLKLIGARQVGKGSLAGQRLLHRLRAARSGAVCVWPYDGVPAGQPLVLAELYPRLFIRRAGLGNAKLRSAVDLDRALQALRSAPMPVAVPGSLDDHDSDALVSAAGLRHLIETGWPWETGLGVDDGWIVGVPRPAG